MAQVEVTPSRDQWLVRVSEHGMVVEQSFGFEDHARAWAAGQCLRLGVALAEPDDEFFELFSHWLDSTARNPAEI